jgi:hypothetical protein
LNADINKSFETVATNGMMIGEMLDQSLSTIAEMDTPCDEESLAGEGIEVPSMLEGESKWKAYNQEQMDEVRTQRPAAKRLSAKSLQAKGPSKNNEAPISQAGNASVFIDTFDPDSVETRRAQNALIETFDPDAVEIQTGQQGQAFSIPDGGRMSIMDPASLPQFQDEESVVSVKPRKIRKYGIAILLCLLVVALIGVVAGVTGSKNDSDHQTSTASQSKAVGSDFENENASDAGLESGPTVDLDGGADAGSDTGADGGTDAGSDGGADTGSDGGADAGSDGGADAGSDGGADTGSDGGADAGSDGGADAGSDGGADTGSDGGADTGSDGGADTGSDGGADTGSDGGADTGSDGGADAGSDGGVDGGSGSDGESGGAGSPTDEVPTGAPSSAPSLSPTPCTNHLVIDKFCYVQKSDNITVDFAQCTPRQNDWIGIYPAGSNPRNLKDNFVEWSWTCGSKGCQGEVFRAELFLPTAILAGYYRAHLVRDSPSGAPYYSDIVSDAFEVAFTC